MKSNEINTIVDSVLSQDQIDYIYNQVESSTLKQHMPGYNQQLANFALTDEILARLVAVCEEVSGISDLKLEAYQFARYENGKDDDGNVIYRPILSPHHDDTFEEPRFTFDLQLKSNTSWALVVEDKAFTLSDNQALTFSGTHQVHWREHKLFEDGEYIDMLFMHLELKNPEKITQEHKQSMYQKEKHFMAKYLLEVDNNMSEFYQNAHNADTMHTIDRH